MLAADKGDVEMVKLLLSLKADTSKTDLVSTQRLHCCQTIVLKRSTDGLYTC
jgi:hypothetical protein